MLVLSRKTGESIVVGDDVYITVLAIKGNQIRIGIDAPKETAVHREEIYVRIRQKELDETYIPIKYRRTLPKIDTCVMRGVA